MFRKLSYSFIFLLITSITIGQNTQKQDVTYIIGKIVIEGIQKTKEEIVLRELCFQEGERYDKTQIDSLIKQSKQNLNNTSLFLEVEILTEMVGNRSIHIRIKLKERWYLFVYPTVEIADRSFNEWWVKQDHKLNRLDYGLQWEQKNCRGRKEELKLMLKAGYAQQLELEYIVPYIDRAQKAGFRFYTYIDRNKEIAYDVDQENQLLYLREEQAVRKRQRSELSFQYRNKIHNKHVISAIYNSVEISGSILEHNLNYLNNEQILNRYLGLKYHFESNHTDLISYPRKGLFLSFDLSKEGFYIQQDVDRYRGEAYLAWYKPLGKRLFYATNVKTEAVSDRKHSFHEASTLGYMEAFPRSYEYYIIPGQAYVLNRHEFKCLFFSRDFQFNRLSLLKKFYKVPVDVYFKSFLDMAYVHEDGFYKNYELTNKLLTGVGVGFDFVTYYDLVIRVEFGFNGQQETGLFFHMGKGI